MNMRRISGSIVKTLERYNSGDKKINGANCRVIWKTEEGRIFTSLSNKQINQIKKLYPTRLKLTDIVSNVFAVKKK